MLWSAAPVSVQEIIKQLRASARARAPREFDTRVHSIFGLLDAVGVLTMGREQQRRNLINLFGRGLCKNLLPPTRLRSREIVVLVAHGSGMKSCWAERQNGCERRITVIRLARYEAAGSLSNVEHAILCDKRLCQVSGSSADMRQTEVKEI